MPSETKNSISHRSKALKGLKEYFDSTVMTKGDDKHNGEPENKKPRNSSDST